jgi:hypothetical protein
LACDLATAAAALAEAVLGSVGEVWAKAGVVVISSAAVATIPNSFMISTPA